MSNESVASLSWLFPKYQEEKAEEETEIRLTTL